jgi:integrase/recombinase XerD
MKTNDALIQAWDQWMRARNLSDKTRRDYRYSITRFLSELSEPTEAAQVTEQDVVVFLTLHATRGPSKNQYLKGLRSFFSWCAQHPEESGVTPETDPTRNIPRPKVLTSPPDAYSVGEVVALLHAAAERSQRRADALQTIYLLGLRRVEMCRLRAEDVDWGRNRVVVRGKGGKTRHVPIPPGAQGPLHRLELPLGITESTLSNWGTQAARDAAIKRPWRSVHILRRSYATHLRRKGADVAVISWLLGHSNLAVTDRYFEHDYADMEQAVSLL